MSTAHSSHADLIQRPKAKSIPRRHIGAFIFDVDGVITETAELHFSAWRRLAEEEDIPFHRTLADSLRGISREASLRKLLGERPVEPERFAEMADRKNAYYIASLERLSSADLLPGVQTLITDLARMDIRLAAASASRNARAVLDRTEMRQHFEVIIDGTDAGESPSGLHRFQLAAAALGVSPDRCVVVEDSTAGIAAARASGMLSIGIGAPERLCSASLVFESFRGVDARTLVHWLSSDACCGPAPHEASTAEVP